MDGVGRRIPRWVTALVAVACVVVGVVLAAQPFTSLAVLVVVVAGAAAGMGLAAAAEGGRWRWLAASGWLVTAGALLAWPHVTVRGIAVVVGLVLIAGGAFDAVDGVRGTTGRSVAAVLSGVASVVLGVVALAWPDVTLLVVAVGLGLRTVMFGLGLVAREAARDRALRWGRGRDARRGDRTIAALALALAVVLAGVSLRLEAARPSVDGFYDPPGGGPTAPGTLLRVEPFERDVPADARAWRILYATTLDEGVDAVASALVYAPATRPPGPAPVVAWAHGTTGVARPCAPSVLDGGLVNGAFHLLDEVLDEGWVLVATDYPGLGADGSHPYLIGPGEARSVLDAVRAARQLDGVDLTGGTVVWGHSQGGHAALWTGMVGPTYAPDVALAGVAALAPASDLVAMVDTFEDTPGGSLFASYVVQAYADAYPDVRVADYVRPTGRTQFGAMAGRCLGEPAVLVSLLSSLATGMAMFTDVTGGPLLDRLDQNVPRRPIDAPLLIAQGEADGLVQPTLQRRYVDARCRRGQPLDYRTYPGRDHLSLVDTDSPLVADLVPWTRDRLAGLPATSTCPTG